MQEKDMREKMNQELDKMAPDILDKILAEPIEPVKNERELFGKNKPLFQQEKRIKRYLWAPVMVAVVACMVILVMVMQPNIISKPEGMLNNIAFNIMIDVNPSISIDVREDGRVDKIKAKNSDAKKIVKQVNKSIQSDTDYNEAMEMVVEALGKNGYIKNKKSAMLVSVLSEDKKMSKEKLNEIKEHAGHVDKKVECKVVYQVCENNEKVLKVAEKNNVSVGKAALCIKLAESEKTSVAKMCKKSIDTLVKKAEKSGATAIDDEIIEDDEVTMLETESVTFEIESVSETEFVEESSSGEEVSTVLEEETETEAPTVEIPETAVSEPEEHQHL